MNDEIKWESPNFIKEYYHGFLIFLSMLLLFYAPSLISKDMIIYLVLIIIIALIVIGSIKLGSIGFVVAIGFGLFISLYVGILAAPLHYIVYPGGISLLISFFLLLAWSAGRTQRRLKISTIQIASQSEFNKLFEIWLAESKTVFQRIDNLYTISSKENKKIFVSSTNTKSMEHEYLIIHLESSLTDGYQSLSGIESAILSFVSSPSSKVA